MALTIAHAPGLDTEDEIGWQLSGTPTGGGTPGVTVSSLDAPTGSCNAGISNPKEMSGRLYFRGAAKGGTSVLLRALVTAGSPPDWALEDEEEVAV